MFRHACTPQAFLSIYTESACDAALFSTAPKSKLASPSLSFTMPNSSAFECTAFRNDRQSARSG